MGLAGDEGQRSLDAGGSALKKRLLSWRNSGGVRKCDNSREYDQPVVLRREVSGKHVDHDGTAAWQGEVLQAGAQRGPASTGSACGFFRWLHQRRPVLRTTEHAADRRRAIAPMQVGAAAAEHPTAAGGGDGDEYRDQPSRGRVLPSESQM